MRLRRMDGLAIALFVASLMWVAGWVWVAACIRPEEWSFEFLKESTLTIAARGMLEPPGSVAVAIGLKSCGTSIACCLALLLAGVVGSTRHATRWRRIVMRAALFLGAVPAVLGAITAVFGLVLLSHPPLLHVETLSEGGSAAGGIALAYCGVLRVWSTERRGST